MDTFFTKVTQGEIENLNNLLCNKKLIFINNTSTRKTSGPGGFTGRSIRNLRNRDFHGGAVDMTPHSQCRCPGFNPCSGN